MASVCGRRDGALCGLDAPLPTLRQQFPECPVWTVAHEIGHFISNADGPSHDDKSSDLMYGDSTPTPGTILRRKRIQRFGRDDK